MSHTNGANGAADTFGKRERRTILEDDVTLLRALQVLAGDNNEPIAFRDLTVEQKWALIPGANPRLVRFKLINIEYDQESFAPTTIRIDPDKVAEHAKDIEAPPRPNVVSNRQPKAKERVNNLANLYIAKVDPPKKPRNPKTEAGYNYDLYTNGMTVQEYLNATYNREQRTNKGKYFNGPTLQLLYSDMDVGNVWVHDAEGNAKAKSDVMPRGERKVETSASMDDTGESVIAAQ